MGKKHTHLDKDERTVKRVCTSLESVLRRKLKIPRERELADPYPIKVDNAIFYLDYIIDTPEEQVAFYPDGPPTLEVVELVAVKEEVPSPCSPPL